MNVPRIAQPLFRHPTEQGESMTLVGLIRSVDTVPVANQDVFRVVVRDIATRQMLRFDLEQSNWISGCWVVSEDYTGIIQ